MSVHTHSIASPLNSQSVEGQRPDDEATSVETIFTIIGTVIAVLFVSSMSVIMALA